MLIYFKELWISRYTDYMKILGGLLIICISQLLVINWTIDFQPNLVSSCITTILVYGIGFPLSNTAILG